MNFKLPESFIITGSIRTKVWACVLIALVGYFIATLSSFYFNNVQAKRLGHLQTSHFPLALLSDELSTTFKEQISNYEDAFLTGETEEAVQGNRLSSSVVELLDDMIRISGSDHSFSFEHSLIKSLKDQYAEFSQLASEVYLRTEAIETSLDLQKKVQQLGSMQAGILQDFSNLAQHLSETVEKDIEQERLDAQRNTIFLGTLFVVVLISAGLVSRWFANRELIEPLSEVQDMVHRFGRDQEVAPPPSGDPEDEISTLATSFWNMTQQLKETTVSMDYVDSIIKNMSGCLLVLAPDLTMQKINENTLLMLGYQEEDLLGKPVDILVSSETSAIFKEKGLLTLLTGKDVENLEICFERSDGGKIPILFSGSVMRNLDNDLEALVCVAADITERKKAEETLRKAEVERALAKTASLAAIGGLTSSIAHEMRNPLSSIKLNLKAIMKKMDEVDPAYAELADIARQQSARLEDMLNDLLNYGKPLALNIQPTNFSDLMHETMILVADEKKKKGVVVEIANSLDSKIIRVDKELFNRALSNLVLNAIQWSPDEGIVHVRGRVRAEDGGQEQAEIQVHDSGPGLNEEKIGKLFQPFFTTRKGGTGLGLANVRKIVEYHGGTVSAENIPNKGARFTILLPLNLLGVTAEIPAERR